MTLPASILAAPASAAVASGGWLFVDARRDEANTYSIKDDPCLITLISMPSSHSMSHSIEGKGCSWAPKNEYSKFGFMWTDPPSRLVPGSVVQCTLTAAIEHDHINAGADPGWGSITLSVATGDRASMGVPREVATLRIGGGTKGDRSLPKSATKTFEWKVPPGSADGRLLIVAVGGAPQTRQTFQYWYEWKEGVSAQAPPPTGASGSAGGTPPASAPAGPPSGPALTGVERSLFTNDNVGAVMNNPPRTTTFILNEPWLVTYLMTYHWNGGSGQTPGTLGLRHRDGTTYGPWQATGRPDRGSRTNLYWEVWPNVIVKPGVYAVLNSHPASWSWNAQSGSGITILKGTPPGLAR